MRLHAFEYLLHLSESPACICERVGVAIAFELGDQLTLPRDPKLLIKDVPFPDLDSVLSGFRRAHHIEQTLPGSKGSFNVRQGRVLPFGHSSSSGFLLGQRGRW
jgi:hypothetical protein